ncbi:MAG TPA: hypothetical protein V6D17_08800 [Candidatus Obscuribacterales bacterium]
MVKLICLEDMMVKAASSKSLVVGLALLSMTFAAAVPCRAQDAPGEGILDSFNRIINIQTESLPNYLNFEGSKVAPLVLAQVDVQRVSKKGSETKPYEHLWYKGAEPVGCRKHAELDIFPDDNVAFRVKHKSASGSDAEIKAAADAVMRVFIDASIRSNSPSAIVVPKASLNRFVQSLGKFGFSQGAPPAPNKPVITSIMLDVLSDPPGDQTTLIYHGRHQ